FIAGTENETLTNIMDEKYYIPKHLPDSCINLLIRMLIKEVTNRATVDEILDSEWLSSVTAPRQVPLIAKRRELCKQDKILIIQQMVDGGIGSKDDIERELVDKPYSHLSATYFIIAER
ncbi:hypothetical protein, partial [Salmonella sp. s51228]|uniref:hypothetical protein n=1 Tax=Salmonella sp. s51228 TaxID=3159652 RepID=UPI0039810EC0